MCFYRKCTILIQYTKLRIINLSRLINLVITLSIGICILIKFPNSNKELTISLFLVINKISYDYITVNHLTIILTALVKQTVFMFTIVVKVKSYYLHITS